MSGDLGASAGDVRDDGAHSSPLQRSATTTATGRRPRSESIDEAARNQGLPLKEMEQAVSTLHKQNFDLKLELFHRRARQTVLEEETEKLSAQNAEVKKMHDDVVAELAQRDKAVNEAVAIIVKLEAQVQELVREREMIRLVEAGSFCSHLRDDLPDRSDTLTPRVEGFPAHSMDDAKELIHMPSFMSERSEHAENLRNVVLGNRSSLFYLRKVSETSTDHSDMNRIASPSLSVLSESSFTSIYGTKGGPDATAIASLPQPELPEPSDDKFDNSPTSEKTPSKESWGSRKSSGTLSQRFRGSSKEGATLSQIDSLDDTIDRSSPLQQMEKLESKLSSVGKNSRPTTSSRVAQVNYPSPTKSFHPQQQIQTKQEKREALRKVLTHSPIPRDLGTIHALPPTPDTISTSTLRRYHNSNDTLPKDVRLTPRESLRDGNINNLDLRSKPRLQHMDSDPSQPASTTAFTSRKNIPLPKIDANLFAKFSHISHSLPQRPRSAGETTNSRTRADSWGADSDSDFDDGGADASHINSNFDPWMRESHKPNKYKRSTSPDLFSFPMDSRGWQTDVLFGAMRGNALLSSPVAGLKRDPLDETTGLRGLTTPQTVVFLPPAPAERDGGIMAPNRMSSLHARTGSMSSNPVPLLAGKLRKSPTRRDSAGALSGITLGGRGRSNSIDSAAVPPPKIQYQQAQPEKRSQYPPISGTLQGQSTRGRPGLGWGKGGLNGFFRRDRSCNERQSTPASPTEANFPAVQMAAQVQPQQRLAMHPGRTSVPPLAITQWARPPHNFDDELSSATPPPIMRNRAPMPQGHSYGVDGPTTAGAQRQEIEMGSSAQNNSQQISCRRKWLSGLGRRNSVKNRAT